MLPAIQQADPTTRSDRTSSSRLSASIPSFGPCSATTLPHVLRKDRFTILPWNAFGSALVEPLPKNQCPSQCLTAPLPAKPAQPREGMRKLRENPISGYQLPADGQAENYCYTPAEVQGIFRHAGPFFGAVFRFLALTGLLMWLTTDDLDVTHRLVRIRTKVFPGDGLRWDPKGDDRNVPLSAPALAIAQKMLAASKSR